MLVRANVCQQSRWVRVPCWKSVAKLATWTSSSPKDRSKINGWETCPPGYVNPSGVGMLASMQKRLQKVLNDLKETTQACKLQRANFQCLMFWIVTNQEGSIGLDRNRPLAKATKHKISTYAQLLGIADNRLCDFIMSFHISSSVHLGNAKVPLLLSITSYMQLAFWKAVLLAT